MGMNTKSGGGGGNLVFLTPINVEGIGTRWARRVTEDTENAAPREAKCGLVHELYYESIDGMIEAVRIVDKGDYGEQLEIAIRDGDMVMVCATPFSGDLGKGFIVRMENIDETLPTEVGLFNKVVNGKDRRYCYLIQGGQKITHEYTKEGSKELPQPIEKKKARGGKSEWDWEEHDNELFFICERESISHGWAAGKEEFQKSYYVPEGDKEQEQKEEAPAPVEEPDQAMPLDDDDVPF